MTRPPAGAVSGARIRELAEDIQPRITERSCTRHRWKAKCKRKIRSITGEQAERGYTVEWRYVTKGRKHVLIKDRHYSNPEGSWGFIHRSALPDRLCRRTQSQCDPDNNGPR